MVEAGEAVGSIEGNPEKEERRQNWDLERGTRTLRLESHVEDINGVQNGTFELSSELLIVST